MSTELESCPSCGALPCDWVDNPHAAQPPQPQRVVDDRQINTNPVDDRETASDDTQRQREVVIEAVVEEAEQACRYVAKHNICNMEVGDYRDGFETACEVCEKAIADHVRRHIDRIPTLPAAASVEAGERAQIVAWLRSEASKRIAVTCICDQQRSLDSQEAFRSGCSCMAAGGIGFGKLPGALLCRDTYEEMWDSIAPKLIDAIERGEHLAAKGKDQAGLGKGDDRG